MPHTEKAAVDSSKDLAVDDASHATPGDGHV
jgi:hypothetical protein